jgi:hypothetical protein
MSNVDMRPVHLQRPGGVPWRLPQPAPAGAAPR